MNILIFWNGIRKQIPVWKMEHRIFRLLFYAMTGDTFVWRMFLNFWMDIRMMGAAS